jgi:hypothetical protein
VLLFPAALALLWNRLALTTKVIGNGIKRKASDFEAKNPNYL